MRSAVFALLALGALPGALAQEARPTEQSLDELFATMHLSTLADSYLEQVGKSMRATLHQALQSGQLTQLNPEQQQIMDDWSTEVTQLLRHEVNWEALRPMITEVYRNNFTQAEIEAMLNFYRSPAGQAVIAKQPQVLQQTMEMMQQRVVKLQPQIAQLQQDTLAALLHAQRRKAPAVAAPAQPDASAVPQPAPAAPR